MGISSSLRSRLLFVGAIFCAFGTMAPTCGKSDDKKKELAEAEAEEEESTPSPAAVTANVAAPGVAAAQPAADVKVGDGGLFKDEDAVVEKFDDGSAAFLISPDGSSRVALASKDGTPITDKPVKLAYEESPNKFVDVPHVYDPEQHAYVGHLPELASTITPVTYEIAVAAVPWKGILQLPAGGTRELFDTAKIAAEIHADPLEGPHGGRIERIGDDDVEVLIDPDSGETRAWVIVDGRVVPPTNRTIAFYFDNRYVEAYPDENDSFYAKVEVGVGWSFAATRKVSVVMWTDTHVHTCLFGYRPYAHIYAYRPIYDVRVVGWTHTHRARWDHHPNTPRHGWVRRDRDYDTHYRYRERRDYRERDRRERDHRDRDVRERDTRDRDVRDREHRDRDTRDRDHRERDRRDEREVRGGDARRDRGDRASEQRDSKRDHERAGREHEQRNDRGSARPQRETHERESRSEKGGSRDRAEQPRRDNNQQRPSGGAKSAPTSRGGKTRTKR